MHKLTSRRARYSVVAMALLATASAVLFLMNAGSSPASDEVTLQGVSAQGLAGIGITLKAPPSDFVPKVEEREIEAAGVSAASPPGFNLPGREIALAQVSDSSLVPPIDRVLWVVSLDVRGARMPDMGPVGERPRFDTPYIYALAFVDPDTGALVYATSAACCVGETQQQ